MSTNLCSSFLPPIPRHIYIHICYTQSSVPENRLVLDGFRIALVVVELDLTWPRQVSAPTSGYALDRIPIVLGG